ncbi:4-hydroxythreonine-4-phosphate dehydrogenase PdxA [Mesorhizobium sp. ES1-4]|uniref:4-hydroxythreonine-4-phosphate dehydrogenase PdxA n=1 Tax=Mesorhizobium sp. ES1-4 TaxID=2876627 RepID=UPI001CC9BB81|nr:4-hydroxythreonine-4-phosphate dehydrogenase PdxA [Mesorhizobium sp. ES1-4]MBZ9799369.1 4-hydroxythreonine-4-phosphate dehydrogenase PdxA [Mesorhizobium sp. ES1-4]
MNGRVAFALGDAAGIGPELAARVLADAAVNENDMIVIGDKRILDMGARHAGVEIDLPVIGPEALARDLPDGSLFVDMQNCDPAAVTPGKASRGVGRASLQNFRTALLTAHAGLAGFVFFTPFNKQAMRMAKSDYVDEIGFIDETIGAARSGREFNVLEEVWNARVTSHIPLRAVADAVTEDRIFSSLCLTVETMEKAGFTRPRIGVAALNPHAGDGRNFGDEDEDIILPAVRRAQKAEMAVTGPIPSDTVFVRAIRGEFDAVMTMFHDQGQIAMKLLGFDRGVTLIAGYPFPIVTPAHGTAYDIAGRGKADTGATFNAVALGRKLAGMEMNSGPDPERRAALPEQFSRILEESWRM